ncbi:NAD(P)-dependent malic enzyme [Alteribacillus iranensis]|uniref:Malate dehydrogenase (Oxaloacetate-decarboxylating) n=1 Tax=Alteribacillus iranensis TaxID=930128 RepID=A0A1I2E433_9BACI|nr:malic enzyme-like NAD(P)-binding protein [Alteribacillus iranensis]SFE87694.1 malate dehydrogenase (oxaloacetate-decarboxylating) [Alteribacillus iranensis]
MDLKERALKVHEQYKGKISINVKTPVEDKEDLSVIYSPGVAEPCKEIYENIDNSYRYTTRGNSVAVVTNGTAVLGLGNIGASAALPVMEGKSALFKHFADIDAYPICLDSTDIEEIVKAVTLLEPTYGGINLEDIAAPECFYIEDRLKEQLNIPVFHDDQHGTAIVTGSGFLNALKVTNKQIAKTKVVVNGAGAAGIAIVKLLRSMGVEEIILCDSQGAIYEGRPYAMNPVKEEQAKQTNNENVQGTLEEVIEGADVFIGVSAAHTLTFDMVQRMNNDAIIFAMANPVPEIMPDAAKAAGAKVVGTGRSDLPNQVNNVLAFPGIFRGALNARATEINEEMKLAAVYAIADVIPPDELHEEYVIPSPFHNEVVTKVAEAVERAAIESGAIKKKPSNLTVRV